MKLDKSTFFLSFFNSRVYGEVKSNIKYFRVYNREALADNKLNYVLLNIIDDHIITDVNESLIRTVLKTEGFIDNEINPVMDTIIDFKLGESSADTVIDEVLDYVRKAVHKTYIDMALRDFKTDPIGLVETLRNFHYVGMAHDKIPFERFSSMNIDEIAQKEMKLSFKTGLDVIDGSTALGGVVTGQLYQVVGRPGGGKSLLMMYLAIRACLAHKKTAYIALGDLDRGAFITRMYSMATDTPLMDSVLDQKAAYEYVSKGDLDKYFNLAVLPAKTVTMVEIVEAAREIDAEVVIIDYDANTKSVAGSMYEEGDISYAAATQLTIGDARTVIMGSQPKPQYWNNDYLDLLCANESSKKQFHIAVMITIGKHLNPEGTPCGFITIAKNRVGRETQTRYMRSSSGLFIEVDPITYAAYADAKINRTLDTQEILDEMKLNEDQSTPPSPEQTEKRQKEKDDLNNFVNSIPDAK